MMQDASDHIGGQDCPTAVVSSSCCSSTRSSSSRRLLLSPLHTPRMEVKDDPTAI